MSIEPEPESIGPVRRALLTQLQCEVHRLGKPALIALSDTDHPVLYTRRSDGRRVAVVAVQALGCWWFLWGRTSLVRADRVQAAARALVPDDPRDKVIDLFSRRPQPRGARKRQVPQRVLAAVA